MNTSGLGSSPEILSASICKDSRNAWIDFLELSYFSICSLATDSANAAIACSVTLSKSKAPAVAILAATGTERLIRPMPMVFAFSKYSLAFDSSPVLDSSDSKPSQGHFDASWRIHAKSGSCPLK